MLFSVSGLHLDFGNGPILVDEAFDALEGEKIGLVGQNGCGKSTLLKVLAGRENGHGKMISSAGMKVHLLEQMPHFECETIWQEMVHQNNGLDHPREEFELKTVLTKLGFSDFDQPIATLSGGQKRRLSLALTLADRADLILLDEPTNHLDIEMIEWLEKWINRSKQTVITITHDRYFLDAVCTRILELDRGHLYSYEGTFETWLLAKKEREFQEAQRQAKLENLYRKELEWVRAGVQARSTKSKSRLDRFEVLRQQRQKLQNDNFELQFSASRLGKKTISWENVSFGYSPDQRLFENFTYTCKRTDRIGLVGVNGSGKSTFLRLLAGDMKPLEGRFEFGSTVKLGYMRQEWAVEDKSMRVLDYLEKTAKQVETGQGMISASAMLERFGFEKGKQYLPIERLSGGEQRRLYLVRTLMEAPNVLLLDEPGNDLDLLTMEVLEDYLDSFLGIVIVVSHDRYFLDRICTEVFELRDDRLWHRSTGGYTDMVARREMEKEQSTADAPKPAARTRNRRPSLSSKEKKDLEQIPLQLEELESQKALIDEQMGQESEYTILEELSSKREAIEEQIETLEMRWLELEAKKEELAL